MAPPHIFLHVTNILINVAVYSVFHLKRPNKITTMFHVNIHVEGPYGTLSKTFYKTSVEIAIIKPHIRKELVGAKLYYMEENKM